VCHFFDTTARQHHADEEALIFPPLVRKADKVLLQHVRRLQQDHGWLEEDWLAISPQLHAVAQGYNWYDPAALRHAVGVFTALYHEHIGLEESLVYPAARHQLDTEAQARDQRVATAESSPAGG
jgi:hemerythrin-like domain-containing protein